MSSGIFESIAAALAVEAVRSAIDEEGRRGRRGLQQRVVELRRLFAMMCEYMAQSRAAASLISGEASRPACYYGKGHDAASDSCRRAGMTVIAASQR